MNRSRTLSLSGAVLEGLEVILSGLLPGTDGYGLDEPGLSLGRVAPYLRVSPDVASGLVVGDVLTLTDPDNTPLAALQIEAVESLGDEGFRVAGALRKIRSAEHGPARHARMTTATDLSQGTVAVFSPDATPADVVKAIQAAGGRRLELVAEGSRDGAASARLVHALEEVADLVPSARVHFIPLVDFDDEVADVTTAILEARGAADVIDLRHAEVGRGGGAVVLFTGLSGAGKSTIARALAEHLSAREAHRVVLLDGDHVRAELASELGFSAADRDRNLQRQAWVGARVAEAGGLAICAPIAPFAASRAAMRAKVEPSWPFLLVHVSTPLATAEERDRKGLYAKARQGLIADFTGIDSPYEIPDDADLSIDTSELSVEQCVAAVVGLLSRKGLISRE